MVTTVGEVAVAVEVVVEVVVEVAVEALVSLQPSTTYTCAPWYFDEIFLI